MFCGNSAAGEEEGSEGESIAEPTVGEELLFARAAIAAIDQYMVGLKAVHRWRDTVTPVTERGQSRLLRRQLGGSQSPDLGLAQRKWGEARAALEGVPASSAATAGLRAGLAQGIHLALETAGEFRLVGAGFNTAVFVSGSLKLCRADEKMLHAAEELRRILKGMADEPEVAELLTLHGIDLELHAAYLRTKGCD